MCGGLSGGGGGGGWSWLWVLSLLLVCYKHVFSCNTKTTSRRCLVGCMFTDPPLNSVCTFSLTVETRTQGHCSPKVLFSRIRHLCRRRCERPL